MLVKIQILVKNPNFSQKSKFWSKIEILVKNRNVSKKSKFGKKSKFQSKIEILSKIEIVDKNRNFDRPKFQALKFGQKLILETNVYQDGWDVLFSRVLYELQWSDFVKILYQVHHKTLNLLYHQFRRKQDFRVSF